MFRALTCSSSGGGLMMDTGTVRNMESLIPKINLRKWCV